MPTEDRQHVHDCTGPDMRCPCGYVFSVPRISFSFDVCDGREVLASDGFNCNRLSVVVKSLREAADKLERLNRD